MSAPARVIAVAVCLAAVTAASAVLRVADGLAPAEASSNPRSRASSLLPPPGPLQPVSSWLGAIEEVPRIPQRVRLPHAEQGTLLAHEPGPRALSFRAQAGQWIELHFARAPMLDAAGGSDRIHIDVWRLVPREHGTAHERLDVEIVGPSALRVFASDTGDYVVSLTPEPRVNVVYGLTIEVTAALPFPVGGVGMTAVHSFFGDSRDAGTRVHEGVDIFAARSTPVLAVADGRAVPRRNELGGRVVFLNTAGGVTYYYAHLERSAFSKPTRVAAGDVIGYVGNSGNAASTPPHLHFGIYHWGHGAVDPMPRLRAARFANREAVFATLGAELAAQGALDANDLAVLRKLPEGSLLWSSQRGMAPLAIAPREPATAQTADAERRFVIAAAVTAPGLETAPSWPDLPAAGLDPATLAAPETLPATAVW